MISPTWFLVYRKWGEGLAPCLRLISVIERRRNCSDWQECRIHASICLMRRNCSRAPRHSDRPFLSADQTARESSCGCRRARVVSGPRQTVSDVYEPSLAPRNGRIATPPIATSRWPEELPIFNWRSRIKSARRLKPAPLQSLPEIWTICSGAVPLTTASASSAVNCSTFAEMFIEQNFGPHIEQNAASLNPSSGSVSSW